MKIQLFGDLGNSNFCTLSDQGFEKSSFNRLVFESKEVGNIEKIRV